MTPPLHDSGETVLKAGVKRTVTLSRNGSGEALVAKRFHSPGLGGFGWIGAPGDWRRARGEREALTRAHSAGLPVPEPVAITRSKQGGWELTMEAVAGARPLTEVLDQMITGPPQAGDRASPLAARLGALLRRVEAAGFVHADPHPGNVLVDATGELWIVDVARSRVGASSSPFEASILRALSRTRELTSRTFRRRIALAWRGPRATPEWSRRVESDATRLRAQEMRDRVSVWRRDSSATEVRKGHDGLGPEIRVRERVGATPDGWITQRVGGSESEVRSIWETLVRTKLHRLPGCEPRSVSLAAPFAVEFDVPAGAGPPAEEAEERTRRQLSARGLGVESQRPGIEPFLAGPDGLARISPFARIVELEPGGDRP